MYLQVCKTLALLNYNRLFDAGFEGTSHIDENIFITVEMMKSVEF